MYGLIYGPNSDVQVVSDNGLRNKAVPFEKRILFFTFSLFIPKYLSGMPLCRRKNAKVCGGGGEIVVLRATANGGCRVLCRVCIVVE